jgi:hypothetical protein
MTALPPKENAPRKEEEDEPQQLAKGRNLDLKELDGLRGLVLITGPRGCGVTTIQCELMMSAFAKSPPVSVFVVDALGDSLTERVGGTMGVRPMLSSLTSVRYFEALDDKFMEAYQKEQPTAVLTANVVCYRETLRSAAIPMLVRDAAAPNAERPNGQLLWVAAEQYALTIPAPMRDTATWWFGANSSLLFERESLYRKKWAAIDSLPTTEGKPFSFLGIHRKRQELVWATAYTTHERSLTTYLSAR